MTLFSPITFADVLSSTARRRLPATVGLPIVVAVTLAIVGAFGTYVSMALPVRLLHFVSVGLAIGGLAYGLSEGCRRYWFDGPLPCWAMLSIAMITAPPGAWIVQQALAIWAPTVLPHVSYRELTVQVLAPNILIGTILWFRQGRTRKPAAVRETEPAHVPSDQAVRARLPARLRHAVILALSAEDHYVRVRTDRGDALILMNLTVAMDALGESAGVRIHRSHWVSRRLAEAATACPGLRSIRVDDNTLLPVSRAGRKLLRDVQAT